MATASIGRVGMCFHNRGGRGHKVENPTYIKDDTEAERQRIEADRLATDRLRERLSLFYENQAHEWNVTPEMAAILLNRGFPGNLRMAA